MHNVYLLAFFHLCCIGYVLLLEFGVEQNYID